MVENSPLPCSSSAKSWGDTDSRYASNRVAAEPPAYCWVIPAIPVVLQAGIGIELAACIHVACDRRVTRSNVAEGVVLIVLTERAIVLNQMTRGSLVIGQRPMHAIGTAHRFGRMICVDQLIRLVVLMIMTG